MGPAKLDSKATKRKKSKTRAEGGRKSQSSISAKGKKPASQSLSTANKGKGKQRDLGRQNSETPSVTSSGASVAAHLVRSSSVDTQQSPTPARLKEFAFSKPAVPKVKPGPMLHNHGSNKKGPLQHSHRPPSLQTQVPKRPSYGSPVAGPSTQPPVRSANSPVTRSNCRYHKISMPEVEDGPHIFFLVPGCSLTDRALILEEEIVDHGDADSDDSERMVPDIESLDINAYVVSIIRLLVGPDKEQEVYFLPKEGEERARKMGRKKSTIIYGDSHTATGHPLSASQTAPTSTSTTNRSGTDYQREMLSPLSSELSDIEDGRHEHAKAQRNSPPAESAEVSNKPQGNGKQPKRRQLGHDAAEYAPGSDDEPASDEEDGTPKKSPTKRANKRPRTTEASSIHEEVDDRQPKKLKTEEEQSKMDVS